MDYVPDLDAINAYFNSIPTFVVFVFTFAGFVGGISTATLINVFDDISRTIKRYVLKKRVDKSAKDLTDYVDSIINRDDGWYISC